MTLYFVSPKHYYFEIYSPVDKVLLEAADGRFFTSESELMAYLIEKEIAEPDGYCPIGLRQHCLGWEECDSRGLWVELDLIEQSIEAYLIDYVQ